MYFFVPTGMKGLQPPCESPREGSVVVVPDSSEELLPADSWLPVTDEDEEVGEVSFPAKREREILSRLSALAAFWTNSKAFAFRACGTWIWSRLPHLCMGC